MLIIKFCLEVFTMFGVAHLFVEFGTSTLMKLVKYSAFSKKFSSIENCRGADMSVFFSKMLFNNCKIGVVLQYKSAV